MPIQSIGIQSKATGVDLFPAPVLSPYPALHSVPIPNIDVFYQGEGLTEIEHTAVGTATHRVDLDVRGACR